jgi:hypothetical protein
MPRACYRLLALLAAWSVALSAFAQFRTIPADAERGRIQHVEQSLVTIDGKSMRLAPGATIRNTQNLVIVPIALPREGSIAEYLVDRDGMISRVWLLTPSEQAREKRKPRR